MVEEYVLLVEVYGKFGVNDPDGKGSYEEMEAVKEQIENDYLEGKRSNVPLMVICRNTPEELAAYKVKVV